MLGKDAMGHTPCGCGECQEKLDLVIRHGQSLDSRLASIEQALRQSERLEPLDVPPGPESTVQQTPDKAELGR